MKNKLNSNFYFLDFFYLEGKKLRKKLGCQNIFIPKIRGVSKTEKTNKSIQANQNLSWFDFKKEKKMSN